MGYTVYITRQTRIDDFENRISPSEWQQFIRANPYLRRFEDYGENAALLPVPSDCPPNESHPAWLDWHQGLVYIRCATERTLPRIFEIAKCLSARVRYRERLYESVEQMLAEIPDWARTFDPND